MSYARLRQAKTGAVVIKQGDSVPSAKLLIVRLSRHNLQHRHPTVSANDIPVTTNITTNVCL